MSQIVEVPGMGRVEFPDGMSDAAMADAIKANMPKASNADRIPGIMPQGKVSVAEDMAKSAASAIPKAAAGLVGLPQTILSLPGKAAGAVGLPTAKSYLDELFSAPNIGDISRSGFEKLGVMYEPQTTPGKFTGAITEGAAGGAPMGVVAALAGAAGGGASELAGQLTDNNPYWRLAAGLMGGLTVGGLASLRQPTGAVLNDVLRDTTPQQMQQAQRLIDNARTMGVVLTGPEAIAQVKRSATEPILGVQRVVEQSRGGGPTMAATMAARPGQNEAAFQGVLNRVGPAVADPTSIAPRVAGAAEQTIDAARQAGNARAAPLYAAAQAQTVPSSTWNNAVTNPAIAEALVRVRNNPLLGLQNETAGSVRWLDAAKKYLDEASNPAIGASALERTGAAGATRAASDLRSSVDAVIPAYGQARGIVERNMRDVVEPLQRQPIGQLAATAGPNKIPTFEAQRQVLFPANPETLTPSAVRQTINQIRVRDPNAARDLTRQFLETQFNEVTQRLVAGENAMGGAKFAAALTGNTRQGENIRAAIQSTGGDQALTGFNRFISIMEAQGKRQPAGSMTEFNKQISEELGRGGLVGQAASTAASPGAWLTGAKDWYERFKYGGNTAELAQIFTDPRSVDRMRRLAMMNPGTERAQALAAVIAASNAPQRTEQPQTGQ